MTAPWWTREAFGLTPRLSNPAASGVRSPVLTDADRSSIQAELRARSAAFAPEWRSARGDDAGSAFLRLFSEQLEAVRARLDRAPQKLFVESLAAAGIAPLPPTSAQALITFTVAPSAPRPVLVARGFQVGARPPGADLVVFETLRDVWAAPAQIAAAYVSQSGVARALDLAPLQKASPVQALGTAPVPGSALYLGLSGPVLPLPTVSIGIRVWSPPGSPPPVAMGGVAPPPLPPPPVLAWEAFDGRSWLPFEVLLDETQSLSGSGVVELKAPRGWGPGKPAALPEKSALSWIRLRIVSGRFAAPPSLSLLELNAANAQAARTVRGEALLPGADGKLVLSHLPVLPDSLDLEVDDDSDLGGPGVSPAQRWTEVSDLGQQGAEARVFALDPLTGELRFGDGVHGMALPAGYANVRALSYLTGGGRSGAVDAGAISSLLSSAPFVTKAGNPRPATGGTDTETQEAALLRGPQEVRARGRAVAAADYGLLALRAPGASVKRAMALPDEHPSFPGVLLPGVVGVLVVPPDLGSGPPVPDQPTLAAVARYLSEKAAPAGVEVVAAAPRYQTVRVEATLVVAQSADVGSTVRGVLAAIDRYLHPLTGGDDQQGWPFGGSVFYTPLLRRLLTVDGVRAIPSLNLVLDGLRLASCTDAAIARHALVWGEGHRIIPVQGVQS